MAVQVPDTIDQFQVHHSRILGNGTYGIVYLGTDLESHDQVAIKFMTPATKSREKFMQSYMRELDALQSIRHPNIVRRIHDKIIDNSVYIVLELCNCNLQTFSASHELPQELKAQFAEEIISAVHCLHHSCIIHRDIKPENILVQVGEDFKKIKLTDFGLSKRIPETDDGSSAFTATGDAGSKLWMAPEVFLDDKGKLRYGKSADCFSLGLVLSQLELHREGELPLPVTGPNNMPYGLHLKRRLANNEHIHEVFVDGDGSGIRQLISRLLRADPHNRCKIEEALSVMQALRGTGQVFRYEEASRVSHDVDDTAAGPQPRDVPTAEYIAVTPAAQSLQSTPPQPPSQPTPPQHPSSLASTRPIGASPGSDAAAQSASADYARDDGRQAESAAGGEPVTKLGHISLPETSKARLYFGQVNVLVGFERSPYFYYYEFRSGKFELVWRKEIPAGHDQERCVKNLSPRGEFYLQSDFPEVCLYDGDLNLKKKLPSPGVMIGLLPGGERAVVNNRCSESTWTEGLRLAVVSASDLHIVHHQLEVPPEGPYTRDDPVWVCGLENGQLAVVVVGKRFCDLYDASGRRRLRAGLPGNAGGPSCTASAILIPLVQQPKICVLTWQGAVTLVLDHQLLGLREDDQGFLVSPVHDKRFSLYVVSPGAGEHQIHTFQAV